MQAITQDLVLRFEVVDHLDLPPVDLAGEQEQQELQRTCVHAVPSYPAASPPRRSKTINARSCKRPQMASVSFDRVSAPGELHATATLGDALWAALAAEWSSAQLVELVVLAGYYHAIAFVTNALRLPQETMGARFASQESDT